MHIILLDLCNICQGTGQIDSEASDLKSSMDRSHSRSGKCLETAL